MDSCTNHTNEKQKISRAWSLANSLFGEHAQSNSSFRVIVKADGSKERVVKSEIIEKALAELIK